MSEEEKKAIEDLRRELIDEDRREYFSNWFAKDLDIILNLIQKQQEELDKKEWLYERALLDVVEANKELEKKDKIIDEVKNILRNLIVQINIKLGVSNETTNIEIVKVLQDILNIIERKVEDKQ